MEDRGRNTILTRKFLASGTQNVETGQLGVNGFWSFASKSFFVTIFAMTQSTEPADPDAPFMTRKGTHPDVSVSNGGGAGSAEVANSLEKESPAWRGITLRSAVLLFAMIPLLLLGVAGLLQPSTSGLGTHQQLGLPPCSMRVIFGIRCPTCGMTTSWSHFMHGHWWASAQANTGGFLLALLAVGTAPVQIRWAWTGVAPRYPVQNRMIFAVLGIAGVTFCDWLVRIWSFS